MSSMVPLLMHRELYGGQVFQRSFINDFNCEGRCSGTISCDASNRRSSPVFALQYSSGAYTKLLAAADEDGYVSIVDTKRQLPTALSDDTSANRPSAQWTAHNNAIFDLSWAKDDQWMYTCSGDTTIRLFDTGYATRISTFGSHNGSVKSISVSPHSHNFFASGARDGCINLWDARRPQSGSSYNAAGNQWSSHDPPSTHASVATINNAHAPPPRSLPGRKRNTLQGRSPPSVTALQFLSSVSGHLLSSGGVDGKVKFWDIRYLLQPVTTLHPMPLCDPAMTLAESLKIANRNTQLHTCVATAHQAELGQRNYAVTSMALRPDSSQLLVSFIRGHHLLYDVSRPEKGPVKWFGGHTSSSFYVKSTFSPDGSHIASGSSDHGVYIWQVDGDNHQQHNQYQHHHRHSLLQGSIGNKNNAARSTEQQERGNDDDDIYEQGDASVPYILQGHEKEVTTVAWCPHDFCQLASAADDHSLRVWNVERSQKEEEKDKGKTWKDRCQEYQTSFFGSAGYHRSCVGSEMKRGKRGDLVDGGRLYSGNDGGGDSPSTPFIDENSAGVGRDIVTAAAPVTATAPSTTTNVCATDHLLLRTMNTPHRHGRMKISNALRQAGRQSTLSHKRTKQQTLAETLFAVSPAGNDKNEKGGHVINTNGGQETSCQVRNNDNNDKDDSLQGGKRARHVHVSLQGHKEIGTSGSFSQIENIPENL